jgi:hypothetical protein
MNRGRRNAFVLPLQFLRMAHAWWDRSGILSSTDPSQQNYQQSKLRGLHGALPEPCIKSTDCTPVSATWRQFF